MIKQENAKRRKLGSERKKARGEEEESLKGVKMEKHYRTKYRLILTYCLYDRCLYSEPVFCEQKGNIRRYMYI